MGMKTADLYPARRAVTDDRYLLTHSRELVRFGVTRRQFAETIREEGVPFDEVDIAQLFREARIRGR